MVGTIHVPGALDAGAAAALGAGAGVEVAATVLLRVVAETDDGGTAAAGATDFFGAIVTWCDREVRNEAQQMFGRRMIDVEPGREVRLPQGQLWEH